MEWYGYLNWIFIPVAMIGVAMRTGSTAYVLGTLGIVFIYYQILNASRGD